MTTAQKFESDLSVSYFKVYTETLCAFNDGIRRIVNKGGTSSGKTYGILQALLDIALSRAYNTGTIISVISETLPHLKLGAIRDFKTVLRSRCLQEGRDYTEANHIYTFGLSIIEFFSADSGKATGPRRDIAYLNECNHIPYTVVEEIEQRTRECIIYDFNPTEAFWIEEKVLAMPDAVEIKTNYLDNGALDSGIRKEIEMKAARDPNYHRVHVLVEYGHAEGLIYPDWEMCSELPPGAETVMAGLDFGFTNDPTVLLHVAFYGGATYADERIWERGLTTSELISRLELTTPRDMVIIADSEDPRMIKEISLAGFHILPATKGPGSVNHGISQMKSRPMFVTSRSINTIRELRAYRWHQDINGLFTNVPVDANNHGMDAWRYPVSHRDQSRGFSGGYRFNSLAGR